MTKNKAIKRIPGTLRDGSVWKKTGEKKTINEQKNGSTSKKPNSKRDKIRNAHIDWITSLARDNAANNVESGAKIPSKEDRKRKRESKKNRRMEQQMQKHYQQQQRGRKRSILENSSGHTASQSLKALTNHAAYTYPSSSVSLQQQSRSLLSLKLSKHRLFRLSQILQNVREEIYDERASTKFHTRPFYDLPRSSDDKSSCTSYDNSELVSSKKRKRRKWNEDSVQPMRSNYSGIGLARLSMYIKFLDPSFYPKLEEEFREHIPGFYGKQRTKAMKRQMDGNMLWRRFANEKRNISSKKCKGMSTEERVKAIIDSSDRVDLLG